MVLLRFVILQRGTGLTMTARLKSRSAQSGMQWLLALTKVVQADSGEARSTSCQRTPFSPPAETPQFHLIVTKIKRLSLFDSAIMAKWPCSKNKLCSVL